MNEQRRYSRAKIMSWVLIVMAFFLSLYSTNKGVDGSIYWVVTVPSACGLYAGKQYQNRKLREIEEKNKCREE